LFLVVTEPFNLEKYQQKLQSIYDTISKVKIIPWDESSAVHIDDLYTTLSWVRDDRNPSGVTQKELKDYTDIFKGDKRHRNPKRILVYGRPGIGKSTFSKKTAFDWSQQRKEILKKFDVVLLIKLRDVCDLRGIRDFVRASKLLAGDEVADDVYDYILRNQEKVLLILDGYDEYFFSGEKSAVRDIWEGSELSLVHVIITTRKEKADELTYHSRVQFEINGFKSEGQVRAFASKLLGDDEKVEEFVSYLEERDLKDLAEIPLLLLMLCTVWKENHFKELPKSRAHICQNFIETLILHTIAKDEKSKQEEGVDAYSVELCGLGKLAFDALLQNVLSFPVRKLPDSILSEKFIKVGLFHVLNAVTFLKREQHVHFIHKSVQEYLAAFYLEELLKESTSCLSEVDSFEKIVKMIEVVRFACELSADAAYAVVSHLGIVGKQEGLTEYKFTEAPCINDLSDNQQQFLTLIWHGFFSCASGKRRDLYPVYLAYAGGVLLINADQLNSVASEHMLKSAAAPEFMFLSGRHTEQMYRDLISVLEDLSAVIVSSSGEIKASNFLKKYSLQGLFIFLKKEEGKVYLYFTQIWSLAPPFRSEMLRELMSSPESTQRKKPVDDESNEQDDSSALCLTESSTAETRATQHCLSCVWRIEVFGGGRKEIETLIDVFDFVTSPREILVSGEGSASDPVLADTLVSRINFTNRLEVLDLDSINLTAKPAAVIARSLYQAPNLSYLSLSCNPLGEGVSDLTRHLSGAPHLNSVSLLAVKMTKKQVNHLSEAVRQTKISELESSYHVSFVIFVTTRFNGLLNIAEILICNSFCCPCFAEQTLSFEIKRRGQSLQIKLSAINQSKLFFFSLVKFRL